MINYKQLTFAREFRAYSQTQMSDSIDGLSQSNLSKFEKGINSLSEDLVKRIMIYLNFPTDFLLKNISNETNTAHYRKRTTITKRDKTRIKKTYQIIGYLIDQMASSLTWPEFKFKTLDIEDGYDPIYIANFTRKLLGLKSNEPVRDINNLLEENGIIIVEISEMEKFDGVSFVSDDGYPVIVINKNFSNDRKRFTIAHEFGHLLMHSVNCPAIPPHRNEKELENEANAFASQLLMPDLDIKSSLYNLKLSYLSELKNYWLTSMSSIVKRAKDLNCIDSNRYKYLNIELSRRGRIRVENSVPVYIDEPSLFKKGYSMHKNELGYSDSELSKAFSLPIDVILKICEDKDRRIKLKVLSSK